MAGRPRERVGVGWTRARARERPGCGADRIGGLGLPFVTVDFALRADGVWRVVEIGDGQVSDRPRAITPEAFVRGLTATKVR